MTAFQGRGRRGKPRVAVWLADWLVGGVVVGVDGERGWLLSHIPTSITPCNYINTAPTLHVS